MADIIGTEGHEVLTGTSENDIINGLSGYDTLDGGEGSDTYMVNATDFAGRYVDFYNDTGSSGTDTILAAEAGIDIGIGTGFSISNGIEIIDGLSGSRITGENDAQIWDFTGIELKGIGVIFGDGGMDEIRGSEQDDTIDGGRDHDILHGGDGNDALFGGHGHDQLFGGNGQDELTGGQGYDFLDGGEGGDTYYVGSDNKGFVDQYEDSGTMGLDQILATENGTTIGLMTGFGVNSGIEVIDANGFDDVNIGGTNDAESWDFSETRFQDISEIYALGGHDHIVANDQANTIFAGSGHDYVEGLGGNDYLRGGQGHDELYGGEGKDILDGGAGNDIMDGGEGADTYIFGSSSVGWLDTIIDTGTSGKDKIQAVDHDTVITLATDFDANNGIEEITAGKKNGVIIEGSDQVEHWDFSEIKLKNIDAIKAGDGMDIVRGSSKGDSIYGEAGHDRLYGDRGNDELFGGDDSDFLYGESGKDSLYGEAGNDILDGGKNNDYLVGGEGYDIFVFNENSGKDTIADFTAGEDLIDFSGFDNPFTFNDLEFEQKDGGLEIEFEGQEIFLENFDMNDLTEDMFIF